MVFRLMPPSADGDRHPLLSAIVISLVGHALVFSLFLFNAQSKSARFQMPSAISVQMVDLGGGGGPLVENTRAVEAPGESVVAAQEAPGPAAVPPATAVRESSAEPPPAEVSLAQRPPTTKTPLKYQTMRPQEVRPPPQPRRAERSPAPAPPVNPLQDTLQRLREQVEREGRPGAAGPDASGQGPGGGGPGGFGPGGRLQVEAIDLYRLEVAFTIQKNWAFADQLAGGRGDRVASIVFKVMPDGRIEDIFFTDRSGSPHLDESAYRAIVKSSPVRPHPGELSLPYVEMGLRFTPKGVQ